MLPPVTTRNRSAVILGAGLTGLSAALELARRGVDHWLTERESEVGGMATTVLDSGYRFDRTGHLLHLRNPARRSRILSLLDQPPLEVSRRSLVYSEGVFTRYPYQSNTHGLPPATAYACVLDFIHARMQPPGGLADNFEQFCRTQFGNAIAERFMIPYNRRLWGVDPSEVTTSWCDRFVPVPSIEDVLAGALGHQPKELGYNVTGLYPRHGIGELARAMGRNLPTVLLNCAAKHIDPKARTVHFQDWSSSYRTLVSTLPLPALLRMMGDLPVEVGQASRQLRCAPLYYLDVALRKAPRLDMHWVYLPEDRFPFYRVGNYAAFSAAMAPPGSACLYVELADRSEPVLDQLWPRVEQGLRELGLIESADDVAFSRLRKLDHAYVIYDHFREPALRVINGYLKSVGIVSTGRYGGWNYSSMEDALEFGEQAAQIALEESS